MNHETNYKDLFWILMKHDHTNLRVKKCWGETYLTKLDIFSIMYKYIMNFWKKSLS